MNANMTIVHTALQTLSSVCDGAGSKDGQGFNGVDTGFGKQLAAQQTISLGQAKAALKMLKKYSKQLQGFGITLPKTVEDEEVEKTFEYNSNKKYFVIRFNHIPSREVRDMMKSVDGWSYHADKNNAWVLPINSDGMACMVTLQNLMNVTSINGIKQVNTVALPEGAWAF